MVQSATTISPEFGTSLAMVILAAVAILDLIGPLAAQFSLRFAGEASPALAIPKAAVARRSDETAGI